ncbi:MAG: hypothetical protein Q7T62_02165 [Undibacterium sp.]|nr:hypothetical protein [Undibacterium sp.]
MTYIDVRWIHENEFDPIRLVSELGSDSFETRKLEFFRNGSIGYAGEFGASHGVELGTVPVPSLEEINRDAEFKGIEISNADFEEMWSRAAVS